MQQVEEFIGREGAITVAQARDLFGSSRKYVLAFLEHLDSTGVTKRNGDERVLRTTPSN
jgi:selenocysteine-specific elongation factor